MPIQQNFPAIRPTLLLNFVNVKALDPRVTFSRASTATYYDQFGVLRTALANVARFDHDPVTGESLGLLIEEQRTNLLTYSEDYSNNYIIARINVQLDQGISPSGGESVRLVETTENGEHTIRHTNTTVNSGVTYTASVYVKKASGRNEVALRFPSGMLSLFTTIVYNLDTGTVRREEGVTNTTFGMHEVGGGWWRLWHTATATATTTRSDIFQFFIWNNSRTYTGDGTSGVYIWGAQLEAGAFPTSYIKTEAAQVTRAADNASMTGTNFSSWYRQDEGTFFVDVPSLPARPGIDMVLAEAFNSAALNNRRSLFLNVSAGNVVWRNANPAGTTIDVNRVSGATVNPVKLAAVWQDSGTFAGLSYNAESVISRSDVVVPLGIDSLNIGRGRANTAYRNGYIRKLAYYPKRLTSAELQGLTS